MKNRVQKKAAKKKAFLPRKVKKILDGDIKSAGIVVFEREKSANNLTDIKITTGAGALVAVSVARHPLDQYYSPHLLDLSAKRHIERVRPTLDNSLNRLNYRDLPAGELLERLRVFDLLAWENSELVNWFKKIYRHLAGRIRQFFRQVDLSPKLPLAAGKKPQLKLDHWQEVALINLLIFTGIKISWLLSVARRLGSYAYDNSVGYNLGRDEVLAFPASNPAPVSLSEPAESWRPPVSQAAPNRFQINWRELLPKLSFDRSALKPLLGFAAIALLLTLPLRSYFYLRGAQDTKGAVLGQAEAALSNLSSAQAALVNFDLAEAQNQLIAANENFISAQKQLEEIKSFLTALADTLPVSNTYRSGKNLLELGEKISKAGEYLVAGLDQLAAESELSLAARANNFRLDIGAALAQLESAEDNLSKIDLAHLPADNREAFAKLRANLPAFIASLKKSDELAAFAVNFLGDNSLKRYLLIFQNDNELRPTGGFMGSFALVDFKNGDLAEIKMPGGGTYDLRAGFKELLAAPEPLQLINPRWEFQDANWWPDWPTSAKNIEFFYNKSDGATIDGVIAVNSDWLGSLLEITGPVDLPDYQKTITAANFELELQKSVEFEYEDKKQPKKILGDLAPHLIERILSVGPEQVLPLATVINKGLREKDILLYLTDTNDQQLAAKNNWDGRIKETGKDYLNVVAANIGAGKTDGVMRQEIYHQAQIAADGSIIDSLLIRRSHLGPTDEDFTNQQNRTYLRVYVPLGSQLLTAKGFTREVVGIKQTADYLETDPRLANERLALIDPASGTKIYTENGKTVFANWLTIEPGEAAELLLVYRLPFALDFSAKPATGGIWGRIKAAVAPPPVYDSYSLLVQKQPGSNDDRFSGLVEYPEGLKIQAAFPDSADTAGGYIYDHQLVSDLFYFVGLAQTAGTR